MPRIASSALDAILLLWPFLTGKLTGRLRDALRDRRFEHLVSSLQINMFLTLKKKKNATAIIDIKTFH